MKAVVFDLYLTFSCTIRNEDIPCQTAHMWYRLTLRIHGPNLHPRLNPK